jgi:hypothetical protein
VWRLLLISFLITVAKIPEKKNLREERFILVTVSEVGRAKQFT